MAKLSFQKIATVPAEGLEIGRIYFETSTGIIKVAKTATEVDKFGGILDATLKGNTLTLKKSFGEDVIVNLTDSSAIESLKAELGKKLNIGAPGDAAGTQSYYGLKKDITAAQTAAIEGSKSYTDTKFSEIPAAITYKGDGTTITQTGTSTVTFSVGTISQDKVSGLSGALNEKATKTELNVVKTTADAAAPQKTTYTKSEVDEKIKTSVGSVYKIKGSVQNFENLLALTNVSIGDVYNVNTPGELNGKQYPAHANFVALKAGAGNQEGMWDSLGGTFDTKEFLKKTEAETIYATKTEVTSNINTKISTLDKNDTAVAKQFVSAVSETDGIITVTRRTLIAEDVPVLPISKVTDLQTTLDGKVPSTRKVNNKTLTTDVVLSGDDIQATVTEGSALLTKTVSNVLEDLSKRVDDAAKGGVTSFAGKTGAITLKATASTNGAVNLTMSNNELQATIVGLKSAAYTNSSDYATAAQGAKADSALQKASITQGKTNGTISIGGTDVAVKGLGSAAYANTDAFDAKGSSNTALTNAKAYTDQAMTWVEFE